MGDAKPATPPPAVLGPYPVLPAAALFALSDERARWLARVLDAERRGYARGRRDGYLAGVREALARIADERRFEAWLPSRLGQSRSFREIQILRYRPPGWRGRVPDTVPTRAIPGYLSRIRVPGRWRGTGCPEGRAQMDAIRLGYQVAADVYERTGSLGQARQAGKEAQAKAWPDPAKYSGERMMEGPSAADVRTARFYAPVGSEYGPHRAGGR